MNLTSLPPLTSEPSLECSMEVVRGLCSGVWEYSLAAVIWEEYEWELRTWMRNGWLAPYPEEKLGPPKGLISLMAILMQNKSKVHPVMDFWELNHHVIAFTANTDVCMAKLHEWRQKGSSVSLLDLRRAYFQVHVHESLWPFQIVKVDRKRYCLTCSGFGLNVEPLFMKANISMVLAQEETVGCGTSTYIEDIYINDDVVPTTCVREHLAQFGLEYKDPEQLKDGAWNQGYV